MIDASTLHATVPPGSGVVDVTVTTAGGTSATSAADRFTYAPTVSIAAPAPGAVYTQTQASPRSTRAPPRRPGAARAAARSPRAPRSTPPRRAATSSRSRRPTPTGSRPRDGDLHRGRAAARPSIVVPARRRHLRAGPQRDPRPTRARPRRRWRLACAGPVPTATRSTPRRSAGTRFSVVATDANGVSRTTAVAYDVVAARPTLSGVRQSAGALARAGRAAAPPAGRDRLLLHARPGRDRDAALRADRGGRHGRRGCVAGARHGARCTARDRGGQPGGERGSRPGSAALRGDRRARGASRPAPTPSRSARSGPAAVRSAPVTLRFTIAGAEALGGRHRRNGDVRRAQAVVVRGLLGGASARP